MTKRNKQEKDVIDQILDQLDLHGMTQEELFGADGLAKKLTAGLLNKALEAEMDMHLGYKKHSSEGDGSGNSRNGYSEKTVITGDGEAQIKVPRDHNGEFERAIVKKYTKRLPVFNDQIISLYSNGMTTRDIQAHLKEMYGVEVSPELISNVTDAVLEDVRQWRSRPLDDVYPIVYLDALRVNSRESGKSVNKALYIALGINMEGRKEVLGFYISDNEGAKFWMNVLTDIRNRGVKDILIACMDGLTGFPEACKGNISRHEDPAVHSAHGAQQHEVRQLQGPQGSMRRSQEDLQRPERGRRSCSPRRLRQGMELQISDDPEVLDESLG